MVCTAVLVILSSTLSVVLPLAFGGDVSRCCFTGGRCSGCVGSNNRVLIFRRKAVTISNAGPSCGVLHSGLGSTGGGVGLVAILVGMPMLMMGILFELFKGTFCGGCVVRGVGDSGNKISVGFTVLKLVIIGVVDLDISLVTLRVPTISSFTCTSRGC